MADLLATDLDLTTELDGKDVIVQPRDGSSPQRADASSLGAGLTEDQVDTRIRNRVENFAETGNAALIPDSKIPDTITRDSELPDVSEFQTQAQVDARVQAGVADWAEDSNTDIIPSNKLPPASTGGGLSQAQVDARVQAGVADWAEDSNTDQIPLNKLGNAPSGGGGGGLTQAQVDARIADWAEEGNDDIIPSAKLPASTRHLVGQGNFDVNPAFRFATEANSADITLDDSDWFLVSVRDGGHVANYEWILGDDWRGLTARNYGNTVGNAGQRIQIAFVDSGGSAFSAFLGRTSDNKVLFSSSSVNDDAMPLVIRGEYESANSGGGGGGGGGVGGLTEAEVDARVQAGVLDWAEDGNTALIPASKLPAATTGILDPDQLTKELFGNFDDLVASVSGTFNAAAATSEQGTGWRTISTGNLITLTQTQYTTGESLQGRTRFRLDSEGSIPFEHRVRILNGDTVLASVHFTKLEGDAGITKDFDAPLAATNDNLQYRYQLQSRIQGLLRGEIFFNNVRLHHGDGAASEAVRAEVSRDTESLREEVDALQDEVAADWAQEGDTTLIPSSKLPTSAASGLTQAQVDARVAAGVSDWAEDGNTDMIPSAKLPTPAASGLTQAQVDARVRAGVSNWAEETNTSQIPLNKLGNVPASGIPVGDVSRIDLVSSLPSTRVSGTLYLVRE